MSNTTALAHATAILRETLHGNIPFATAISLASAVVDLDRKLAEVTAQLKADKTLTRDFTLLLGEALAQAQRVFGHDATYAVEPVQDDLLTCLVIRTTLGPEEGSARMDALNQWWYPRRADGRLFIALNYVAGSHG